MLDAPTRMRSFGFQVRFLPILPSTPWISCKICCGRNMSTERHSLTVHLLTLDAVEPLTDKFLTPLGLEREHESKKGDENSTCRTNQHGLLGRGVCVCVSVLQTEGEACPARSIIAF